VIDAPVQGSITSYRACRPNHFDAALLCVKTHDIGRAPLAPAIDATSMPSVRFSYRIVFGKSC